MTGPQPGPGPAASPTTQWLYSGRFGLGSGPSGLATLSSYNDFVGMNSGAISQGLRLRALNITQSIDDGTVWFTGVWTHSSEGYFLWTTPDWDCFEQKFNELAASGIGLVDINLHVENGTVWYTGVWLGRRDVQQLFHDLPQSQLTALIAQQNQNGVRLMKVQCRADANNNVLFTALFEKGIVAGNGYYLTTSWRQFYNYFQNDPDQNNVSSLDVFDYGVDGAQQVGAVYLPGEGEQKFILAQSWDDFSAQWQELTNAKLRLQSIEVQQMPVSWPAALQQALASRAVGYSFAILHGGPPPLSGAYGQAVKPGSNAPVAAMTQQTPLTLGSISKTIEAVAMLLAIQMKKSPRLTLQTPFFSVIDGFKGISSAVIRDPKVKEISILDLLTHTAGLDEPPWVPHNTDGTLWAYIRNYIHQYMNPEKLVNGKPGQVYCYSNAAFLAIRGVVQAIFKADTYTGWVTNNMLKGLGMNSTYIPDPGVSYDIRYYMRDQSIGPNDGAGPGVITYEASWNSSADDMALFLAALRGTGLLNQQSLDAMFTPWPLPYIYDAATNEEKSYNGYICLGFDAVGQRPDPPAPYLLKNGSYTNYSQAAIMRLTDPLTNTAADAVLQINTDTVTIPNSGHGDSDSIWPQNLLINIANKLET